MIDPDTREYFCSPCVDSDENAVKLVVENNAELEESSKIYAYRGAFILRAEPGTTSKYSAAQWRDLEAQLLEKLREDYALWMQYNAQKIVNPGQADAFAEEISKLAKRMGIAIFALAKGESTDENLVVAVDTAMQALNDYIYKIFNFEKELDPVTLATLRASYARLAEGELDVLMGESSTPHPEMLRREIAYGQLLDDAIHTVVTRHRINTKKAD